MLFRSVGQSDLVERVRIAVQAAQARQEPVDHVLLHGPPGLGKTTLAHVIAAEMGTRVVVTSGPALTKAGDLVAVYAEQHSQPFGYGLFNTRSELCVRLLWHGSELPGDDAWRAKLAAASALRTTTLRLPTQASAWRVVHAEADGLSGLVVDNFAGVLSAEAFSLGMYQRGALLLPMLAEMVFRHNGSPLAPSYATNCVALRNTITPSRATSVFKFFSCGSVRQSSLPVCKSSATRVGPS